MNVNSNRRSQAERTARTRAALVAAARRLFAERGFAGVGTEAIVRAAGLTRGALYHQFPTKIELFAAVFETVEAEIMERIGGQVAGARPDDALAALEVGAAAWLEACADPAVHRIVLVDGPAVLGWARWREIGLAHSLGLVTGVLEHAEATGQIPSQPVDLVAQMLIGALDEAVLHVAAAGGAESAQVEARAIIRRFIRSLSAAPGEGRQP